MTPETRRRRKQLQHYVEAVLEPDTAVQAVIGIGSIATGHMHATSDIDAILFLHPFDPYVAPAEAIWLPDDDSYHSIFSEDPALHEAGVPLDLRRLDWSRWSDESFSWPEPHKAEISTGWMAFERTEVVEKQIKERTAYPDDLQLARLDEAIIWLDQHLDEATLAHVWDNLETAVAHHRLQAAYENLVQALFAFNRQWRPWRNREMSYLLKLPWLPDNFAEQILTAANSPSLDKQGYLARADVLNGLFQNLLEQLSVDGLYSNTPVDQAFLRRYDEPGRAWNLNEWVKYHTVRRMSRQS